MVENRSVQNSQTPSTSVSEDTSFLKNANASRESVSASPKNGSVSHENVKTVAVGKAEKFLNAPLRYLILVLFAVFFIFLLYGGEEAQKNCNNEVKDWFPKTFPETQKLAFFKNHFGSNEMVLISWDGLTPEDTIQETLAAEFLKVETDENGRSLPPLVGTVLTTKGILERLDSMNEKRYSRQKPPKSIRELSEDKIQGWCLSRDRREACVAVGPSEHGVQNREALLEKLYADTMRVTGLTHEQIHLAGVTCDSVEIDRVTKISQKKIMPLFIAVCTALLIACLRNPILCFTVLVIAGVNRQIGPAAIYFTGSHMDSISLLIVALTFVLMMESGIHLANYYRESLQEGGLDGAVMRTIRKGLLPCILATVTTVLGMGSLAISQVSPICHFGVYTSIALLIGTFTLFIFLGAFWENWPPFEYYAPGIRRRGKMAKDESSESGDSGFGGEEKNNSKSRAKNNAKNSEALHFENNCWAKLARFICGHYWAIIGASVLLTGVFSLFVSRLETNISILGMLSAKNEVIVDYDYLEKKVGGLIPLEVVLRIPRTRENEARSLLERLELVGMIQSCLRDVPGVDGVVSILNVLPDPPPLRERSLVAVSTRRIFSRQLEENLTSLEDTKYYFQAAEEEMWRISVRVQAIAKLKYQDLLKAIELKIYETLLDNGITYSISPAQIQESAFLKEALETVEAFKAKQLEESGELRRTGESAQTDDFGENVASEKPSAKKRAKRDEVAIEPENDQLEMMKFKDVSLVVTGAIPLVFKAQEQLLRDLIDSFLSAFILISITLILLLRSFVGGMAAMFPNILPSIVVFGMLALLGVKVDIGSMMTASVALGVTVDGTLHLLTWFKRGILAGCNRQEAIIYAYSNCATAMVQTTVICSLTFLVFTVSDFVPEARFAWMLCILLVTALVTDLLLTPSLLASPFGAFFVPKKFRKRGSRE